MIALPIVVGPTGSGKSDLAIELALAIGGEIVNCDSLQIYRHFDIGTAKVPEAERRGVPHHLIDLIEPGELFSAGQYGHVARQALGEIAGRGRVPIVVGGTGFYLRALLEGLSPGPARDESIRQKLSARTSVRLHRILSRLDPVAAARIHANDKNKLIRALEVRLVEGKPITAMFEQGRDPLTGFRPIKIGLSPPREMLYRRLDARAERIFEEGLLEEVRGILARGVPRDAKPFESLGYKQALQVVEGQLTMQQALESTQQETRRYAKRQLTWFRKEQNVHWIAGFGDDPAVQQQALAIIQ
ncbi:MAG TPA: tRNA (adenosine(37)-N6)-dimethylallyltransferase MiaA [Bryobacteraceae bacterium]|nr:tRNA (adenosine(37)-N6)-dimethylallyltransferase MiaA [Bryobacteraceae bacterium]